MSKFQKKDTVRNIVSGHEGYVAGICDVEGDRTQYLHLHIDGDGDSRKDWVAENELEAMAPGDLPPFPNPYATVGGGSTPPGGPG